MSLHFLLTELKLLCICFYLNLSIPLLYYFSLATTSFLIKDSFQYYTVIQTLVRLSSKAFSIELKF